MGTCVDWYSSILPALESAPPVPELTSESLAQLAADWRIGFFKETFMRREASQPVEDIDVTHRRVLNWLLLARGVTPTQWDDGVRSKLVAAWHQQRGTFWGLIEYGKNKDETTLTKPPYTGWPDVAPGLERLKQKYFMYGGP